MHIKFYVGLLFSSLFFYSMTIQAKSPVFKISDGDNYIYIGGTIHLLSASDYPLPTGFDRAFNDAQSVFFEVDTAELELAENQEKILSVMTYQDGRTLDGVLNQATYEQFSAFLAERQIPIQAFNQLTPAAISITLTVVELKRLGLGDETNGVDAFFQRKTDASESKAANFLETGEEQIGFINELNNVDPNLIIKSSIDDLANFQAQWKLGVDAWRRGDLNELSVQLGGDTMKEEFPLVYQALLTNRNNRWLTKIKPMFKTKGVELILVGALHLTGDDSLIDQLKGQGFRVEQLDD